MRLGQFTHVPLSHSPSTVQPLFSVYHCYLCIQPETSCRGPRTQVQRRVCLYTTLILLSIASLLLWLSINASSLSTRFCLKLYKGLTSLILVLFYLTFPPLTYLNQIIANNGFLLSTISYPHYHHPPSESSKRSSSCKSFLF